MDERPFPAVVKRTNVYVGERFEHETIVTVNGRRLDWCLHIRNHSPTGLNWGYGGSGPAQLALAILVEEYGETVATHWYQDFKWHVIGALKEDRWSLTSERIYYAMVYLKNKREGPNPQNKEAPF